VLQPLPAQNSMELGINRSAVFLSNEVNRESLRNPHRLQNAFLGIDAVFQLDVIVVRGTESAADPGNDPVGMPHQPAYGVAYAMAGFRFEHRHHFWTAIQNVSTLSGWYQVRA